MSEIYAVGPGRSSGPVFRNDPWGLQVDAHDRATKRRSVHFSETGGGEHADRADVEFSEDDFLRRHHRVSLNCAGATLSGEIHRRTGQRRRDALPAKASARDEAGHGPDAAVGLVLRSPLPWDAVVTEQARVLDPRFDCAPTDRFVAQEGSSPRKATSPLVASPSASPHPVCRRSRRASSSDPTEAHDSPGCILNLWHQHLDGSPRVPKTHWISSQPASHAGMILG